MPLQPGSDNETIAHNAGVELKHGKPKKQAWAIAYAYARRHKTEEKKDADRHA